VAAYSSAIALQSARRELSSCSELMRDTGVFELRMRPTASQKVNMCSTVPLGTINPALTTALAAVRVEIDV
jgi:hypothetical protein